jgi:phenylacetate-CoA ligase
MLYNKEIETLPLHQLRKLQSKRFVEQVHYIYRNQKFYKKLWDQNGININSIKSIEDVMRFPFTYKDDLHNNYPFGLLAAPHQDILRIHCS